MSQFNVQSGAAVGGQTPVAVAGEQQGPESTLSRIRNFSIEFGPGLKDVMNFTSQLSVMIKAGIDIRSAIEGIADQVENRKFKGIVDGIRLDLEAGKSFSDALSRHPKVFSPLYINMVRASELSGNFAEMLERIAAYQAQQCETRSMVIGAMIYPSIIGIMAVVTTVFLLTFVLPSFTQVFAGNEDLLPASTTALIAISDFMRTFWYVLIGMVIGLIVLFKVVVGTPGGRAGWDKTKLKLPLFRKMLRAMYISRGVHTMGELVGAGVPMLDTIRITGEVSGNTVYKAMWQSVHTSVQRGDKIVTPLFQANLLPRNVVQMIGAGEESGSLSDVMRDVSEFYAKELKATIKAVTSMMEPLMIVVMGLVVGFIAMSIILPIFKMSSLVK